MARNDVKCNHPDCEYLTTLGDGHTFICGYILMEGESRKCKCSEDCDKYRVKRKRKKYVDYKTGHVIYDIVIDEDEVKEVEELTKELDYEQSDTAQSNSIRVE